MVSINQRWPSPPLLREQRRLLLLVLQSQARQPALLQTLSQGGRMVLPAAAEVAALQLQSCCQGAGERLHQTRPLLVRAAPAVAQAA